ncbi:MAG: hypothetical protein HY075_04885 [Deltaproteobacteria bacterium]|nr:hypothetical protein [Deltaproteobacteria bacterium]
MHSGLQTSISDGLRGVIERVDSLLNEYQPEFFVVLGSGGASSSSTSFGSALAGMANRWGKRAKLQLVAQNAQADFRETAKALGCEVHNELVWGRYRFVEREDRNNLEVQLLTICGGAHYSLRVGAGPFGGMKLPVFLKGFGRLTLPSVDPTATPTSVFRPGFERCDVFAVGHQRVLPLGKVCDLKSVKGIVRGLPISKATLAARRRAPAEPSEG